MTLYECIYLCIYICLFFFLLPFFQILLSSYMIHCTFVYVDSFIVRATYIYPLFFETNSYNKWDYKRTACTIVIDVEQ